MNFSFYWWFVCIARDSHGDLLERDFDQTQSWQRYLPGLLLWGPGLLPCHIKKWCRPGRRCYTYSYVGVIGASTIRLKFSLCKLCVILRRLCDIAICPLLQLMPKTACTDGTTKWAEQRWSKNVENKLLTFERRLWVFLDEVKMSKMKLCEDAQNMSNSKLISSVTAMNTVLQTLQKLKPIQKLQRLHHYNFSSLNYIFYTLELQIK